MAWQPWPLDEHTAQPAHESLFQGLGPPGSSASGDEQWVRVSGPVRVPASGQSITHVSELPPGVWPHTLTCRCCLMPAVVTGCLCLERRWMCLAGTCSARPLATGKHG